MKLLLANLAIAVAVGLAVFGGLKFAATAHAHEEPAPHCSEAETPPFDVVGVHYKTNAAGAKAHFTDVGFDVVGTVHVDQGSEVSCNELRDAAYNAWRNCRARTWTYSGDHDYSPQGGSCALYYFNGSFGGACGGNPRGNDPGFAKEC